MRKVIWIAWERQRRSVTLASKLADEYFEFNCGGPQLLRYLRNLFNTSQVLLGNRGNVVFIQNPSMILALYAVLLRPLLHFRLIVDRHTDIYLLNEGEGFLFSVVSFMSRMTLRYADFTIVSNRELVPHVTGCKGKALVLPDPYPQVDDYIGSSPPLPADMFTIFCVASWSDDEPLDAYVAAARTLSNVKFIISGNPRGRDLGILSDLPANVECTGFLSEPEYYRVMASSQGVIAFSSRRATLVCGGYEAVVLGKPFITGNSSALRSYFKVAYFSDGSPADLVKKVILMQSNYSEQQRKVRQFHRDSSEKWQDIFDEVKSQIYIPIKN